MASTLDYAQFICAQIEGAGEVRYRKMFGEYMIYVDDKPVLMAADNICYVKMHPAIEEWMQQAETGSPYEGAKPHYILDIDNRELATKVTKRLAEVLPYPKSRAKKKK